MLQGGLNHRGRLRVSSGAKQQFGKAQGRRGVGRIGFQGFPVPGFGFGGAPQHFKHQRAVRQRPGARRTGGAFEHLVEEGQRALRIPGHREGGGGGGANPGGKSLPGRRQNAVEQGRRGGRIAPPQPRVREPASRAQRRSFQRFAGPGHQRSKHAGGRVRIAGQQVHAGLPDGERRIRRIPDRGRLRHAPRLREVPAIEQESQQFRPFVPARFTERRKQQVAATHAEPAFLVARKEALPLGSEGGIRILGQQLAEPEPGDGVLRGFRDGPAEPVDGFPAPSEEGETAAELTRRSGRRARRLEDGFEERQGSRAVVLFDAQPRTFEKHRGRLTGGGRTKHAARLRQETRLAELGRQFHPQLAGKRLVVFQQFGHCRPSLVVPAQDGEQPGAEGQVVRFGGARPRELPPPPGSPRAPRKPRREGGATPGAIRPVPPHPGPRERTRSPAPEAVRAPRPAGARPVAPPPAPPQAAG